jgi:hypothetical protein
MNGPVSTKDEIVSVGAPLPRIGSAEPLDGRKVLITWRNGETKTVDLAPALASRRIYMPLRSDDALFQSLHVSEFGDAIEWDGGLDFSASWLERLPSVGFTNADFRAAMSELGLSLEGMAAALEISRRLVAEYRKDKPIPHHIALATQYLAMRQARLRHD